MNGPDGKNFVWGSVWEVHALGPYSIVEYIPTETVKRAMLAGLEPHKLQHEFHPYVDDQDIGQYASSLDDALALAIAHRNGDIGAARYFMKMLGKEW